MLGQKSTDKKTKKTMEKPFSQRGGK
jgi:hypothetical protein